MGSFLAQIWSKLIINLICTHPHFHLCIDPEIYQSTNTWSLLVIRYKTQKIDEDHQEADGTFARCTLRLRELNSQVEISTHPPTTHPLTLVFSTRAGHLSIISTLELVSNNDGLKLWMEAHRVRGLTSSGQVKSAGWETAHEATALQSRHCAHSLPRSQHDWDYASSARAGQTPHYHTHSKQVRESTIYIFSYTSVCFFGGVCISFPLNVFQNNPPSNTSAVAVLILE